MKLFRGLRMERDLYKMNLSANGLVICEAIERMQRLQFVYNNKLRIVEPQFYGIGRKGQEQLRGYQINEEPFLEKLFDVEKMKRLELLPFHFSKPGPHYNRNDSAFVKEICKLK
jgi:hypothetical protein